MILIIAFLLTVSRNIEQFIIVYLIEYFKCLLNYKLYRKGLITHRNIRKASYAHTNPLRVCDAATTRLDSKILTISRSKLRITLESLKELHLRTVKLFGYQHSFVFVFCFVFVFSSFKRHDFFVWNVNCLANIVMADFVISVRGKETRIVKMFRIQ